MRDNCLAKVTIVHRIKQNSTGGKLGFSPREAGTLCAKHSSAGEGRGGYCH